MSSKLLASYIFEPDVASLGEELLSYAKTEDDYDIKEYYVIQDNPINGRLYDDVFFEMKKKFNIVILGISKPQENGNRVLIKNPDYDVKVESGDYLILVCNGKRDKEIQSFFGIEEGYIHN